MTQENNPSLAPLRVSDIRPIDVMVGQAAAEQKDIDWLKAHRSDFVKIPCPACGVDDGTPLYEKKGMPHIRCRACDTQYASPRPPAGMMQDFYTQSANYTYWAEHVFPASSEVRRQRLFAPRAEKVREITEKYGVSSGTILEIGSAYGLFCDEIRKLGIFKRVIGIEPTPALAQICRDLGVEVIESSYEKAELGASVDMIAHFEVIEHLFCPEGFLNWCHSILKPGGYIISTCPNIAGLEAMLLGRESGAVDHEHVNLFTPQSLSHLHERCGFEVVEVTTPGCLDLDLVRQAIAEGRFDPKTLDPAIKGLIEINDPNFQARLTALLQEAKLTSNMMMIARKSP